MKILNNKGTWIMVVIFLATLGLMVYDPLKVKVKDGYIATVPCDKILIKF